MRSSLPARRPHPNLQSRQRTGRIGERFAAEHMQRLGYQILARNVRSGTGEIDLVAHGMQTIVFVEVKTRRVSGADRADVPATTTLERLRAPQRARLRREAAAWLRLNGVGRPRAANLRFDAIGVTLSAGGALMELDHVESAW